MENVKVTLVKSLIARKPAQIATAKSFGFKRPGDFVVVANKMDKLKKSELEPNLKTIREDLNLPDDCIVIPFSAEKGNGRDELVKHVLAAVKEK